MDRLRLPLAVAIAAVALAGCGEGSTTPRPGPSGDRLSGAQRELATIAGLAARASYDATYSLAAATGESGTLRIVASPPSYRVDVSLGGTPSIFIQHEGTVVSCATKASTPSCFLVARPGEPVPELFDPGVQRLFIDAVADVAAHPERYDVAAAAPASPAPIEASACFDVERLDPSASASTSTSTSTSASATAPPVDPTGFETGQYCFATDGLLTRLAVSTGTLRLTKRGPAPTPALFSPPASPAALPDLPSPSPPR